MGGRERGAKVELEGRSNPGQLPKTLAPWHVGSAAASMHTPGNFDETTSIAAVTMRGCAYLMHSNVAQGLQDPSRQPESLVRNRLRVLGHGRARSTGDERGTRDMISASGQRAIVYCSRVLVLGKRSAPGLAAKAQLQLSRSQLHQRPRGTTRALHRVYAGNAAPDNGGPEQTPSRPDCRSCRPITSSVPDNMKVIPDGYLPKTGE